MHRLIPIVGKGTEVVAAAVTSIVLTVLALTRSVFAVHADQTVWMETTADRTSAPVGDVDDPNGGESAWV